MPLPQDELLLSYIKRQEPVLQHNKDILCILEGDLLSFIEEHLRKEFSEESFKAIQPRISPINYLTRIIDKLSKIYGGSVNRTVYNDFGESEQDQRLLDMYVDSFKMNSVLNTGNEFFNAFKTNLNQPFIDVDGTPRLRAIPNDRFLVYSNNKIDQTIPTHVILPFGQNVVKGKQGTYGPYRNDRLVDVFKVFTDDEIYMLDADGVRTYETINPNGENPYGVLPFMYANRSNSFLMPPVDTDTKRMTILLPVLMSDLNYAVKYQTFSLIYAINADSENLKLNPNMIWMLKSDVGSDQKPEIGQIKPEVDISSVIELITTQLSMWLNSRNIRPGSISDMNASDPVSGISKLVDEMDTSDERKRQVTIYKSVEQEFWFNVMHKLHPVWVKQGIIKPEFRFLFSPSAKVDVNFPEQLPMIRRGQLVKDLIEEVNGGLLSRETALRKANPEWSTNQLEQEMEKIAAQSTIEEIVEDEPTTQMTETGKTSVSENHSHSFTIDMDGNGQTDVVEGHMHDIQNGSVVEADNHTHTINR